MHFFVAFAFGSVSRFFLVLGSEAGRALVLRTKDPIIPWTRTRAQKEREAIPSQCISICIVTGSSSSSQARRLGRTVIAFGDRLDGGLAGWLAGWFDGLGWLDFVVSYSRARLGVRIGV